MTKKTPAAAKHPKTGAGYTGSQGRSAERPSVAAKRRLPREERERRIIQEAVRFFAEVGFGGDTRELARRINVTHPLLFRYFPTKDALIERVVDAVYLGRWNPYWEEIIEDRTVSLRDRMLRFYKVYARTILTYEWVRLFMFAGLRGASINQRIFAMVTERIVKPLCAEIRREFALPSLSKVSIHAVELELVWGLNSRIFYFGIRKYIYGMPLPDNLDELIEAEIGTFFDGIGATLKSVLHQQRRRRIAEVEG